MEYAYTFDVYQHLEILKQEKAALMSITTFLSRHDIVFDQSVLFEILIFQFKDGPCDRYFYIRHVVIIENT